MSVSESPRSFVSRTPKADEFYVGYYPCGCVASRYYAGVDSALQRDLEVALMFAGGLTVKRFAVDPHPLNSNEPPCAGTQAHVDSVKTCCTPGWSLRISQKFLVETGAIEAS